VITHAHSDHARPGSKSYLTTADGRHVLAARLGDGARIESIPYGRTLWFGGVGVSLHPAGHVLGSAQVRAEYRGEVWVISGDYKLDADPTCRPFEPVRCHTFVTESTFGLPVYRWPAPDEVFRELDAWWRQNQEDGLTSIVYAYSLGKAQRVLAGLNPERGPIGVHGAVAGVNHGYRLAGIRLPEVEVVTAAPARRDWSRTLIVAPPSAQGTPWLRRFGDISAGFASGWMRLRGTRRRRAVDRGFILSDHADWPGLLSAIHATGSGRVLVTHGIQAPLIRFLREQGFEADALQTRYEGEPDEPPLEPAAEELA
jgi:putative mRNA 3-end processing factor